MSKLAALLKDVQLDSEIKKKREILLEDLRSFLASSYYGDLIRACEITRSSITLASRDHGITLEICRAGMTGKDPENNWRVELSNDGSLRAAVERLIPRVEDVVLGCVSNYHGGTFISNVDRLLGESDLLKKLTSAIASVRRTLGLDAPKLQE